MRKGPNTAEVEVYGKGKNKRWRVGALNTNKLANGGQGYSRTEDMENGMLETAQAILRYFARRGGN